MMKSDCRGSLKYQKLAFLLLSIIALQTLYSALRKSEEVAPLEPRHRADIFRPPVYKWINAGAEANRLNDALSQDKLASMDSHTSYLYNSIFSYYRVNINGVKASTLTGGRKVYASMATMDSRIGSVHLAIRDLLAGSVVPDHLFLFISAEPYLLDKGISIDRLRQYKNLLYLSKNYPFSIIQTDNIGPHRKLLPLLARKWDEDCIIATFDDEDKENYHELSFYLSQLLNYHVASRGSSIVGLKTRRMAVCDKTFKISPYQFWGTVYEYGIQEVLMLPTGTGSIMYRPRFFHPIVFDREFINITRTADDLMFRLSAILHGVPTIAGCKDKYKNLHRVDRCPTRENIVINYNYPPSDEGFPRYKYDRNLQRLGGARNKEDVGARRLTWTRDWIFKDKQVSLFADYNDVHLHGNDHSLASAVAFLEGCNIINGSFADLVKGFMNVERPECLKNPGDYSHCHIHCM